MFQSLSIYSLYEKRLVETISYSEKARYPIKKIKAEKEKTKKERSVGETSVYINI